jgi:hypothetical protein
MRFVFRHFFVVLSLALVACASGNCHQIKNEKAHPAAPAGSPEAALPQVNSTPAVAGKSAKPAVPSSGNDPAGSTVLIYKYDGSLQCAMGKGLSPEEMEKDLGSVKALSRNKRSDGLMHIQVCGQPTGMVNVYEINSKSLPDAEKRGFKKWNLD